MMSSQQRAQAEKMEIFMIAGDSPSRSSAFAGPFGIPTVVSTGQSEHVYIAVNKDAV